MKEITNHWTEHASFNLFKQKIEKNTQKGKVKP